MADIHHVISLGIGSPADIPHLVLFGLSPNPGGAAPEPGDLITSQNAYFARAATMRSGVFGREVTGETITFARDVTTQDTER